MAVLGPDTCWLSSQRGVSVACWSSTWTWEGFAQRVVCFCAIHTGSWFSRTSMPRGRQCFVIHITLCPECAYVLIGLPGT